MHHLDPIIGYSCHAEVVVGSGGGGSERGMKGVLGGKESGYYKAKSGKGKVNGR